MASEGALKAAIRIREALHDDGGVMFGSHEKANNWVAEEIDRCMAPAPSLGVPSEPPAKRMMRDRTTGYPHVYSPDCRGLGCFDYEREPASIPARPELDKAEGGTCVHGEGKTALIDLPWPKFQCECCGLMSTERSFPIGWVQLGESSRGNGKTLASYCEACKSSSVSGREKGKSG